MSALYDILGAFGLWFMNLIGVFEITNVVSPINEALFGLEGSSASGLLAVFFSLLTSMLQTVYLVIMGFAGMAMFFLLAAMPVLIVLSQRSPGPAIRCWTWVLVTYALWLIAAYGTVQITIGLAGLMFWAGPSEDMFHLQVAFVTVALTSAIIVLAHIPSVARDLLGETTLSAKTAAGPQGPWQ